MDDWLRFSGLSLTQARRYFCEDCRESPRCKGKATSQIPTGLRRDRIAITYSPTFPTKAYTKVKHDTGFHSLLSLDSPHPPYNHRPGLRAADVLKIWNTCPKSQLSCCSQVFLHCVSICSSVNNSSNMVRYYCCCTAVAAHA